MFGKKQAKIHIGDIKLFPFPQTKTGRMLTSVIKYLEKLDESLQDTKKAGLVDIASFSFRELRIELSQVEKSLKSARDALKSLDELFPEQRADFDSYDDLVYEYEVKDRDGKKSLEIKKVFLSKGLFNENRESLFSDDDRYDINIDSGSSKDTGLGSKLIFNSNVMNLLFNLDEISSFAEESTFTKFFTGQIPEMEIITDNLLKNKNPCWNPMIFVERVYQSISEDVQDIRSLNKKHKLLPVDWREFIDEYIIYPSPFYRIKEDPINSPPFAKLSRMSGREYRKQKEYFSTITKNPQKAQEIFGKQYEDRSNSYHQVGDTLFSKEQIESIRTKVAEVNDSTQKFELLHTEILDKVCLNSIITKVVECKLPPLQCEELIKEYGIKRIVPFLRPMEIFEPRLRQARLSWEKKREKLNVRAIRFDNKAHASCELPPDRFGNNLNDFSISFGIQSRSNKNRPGTHILSMYKTKGSDERVFAVKVGPKNNLAITFHVDGTYDNRIEVQTSDFVDTRDSNSDMLVMNGNLNDVLITYNKSEAKVYINGIEDIGASVKIYGPTSYWTEETTLHKSTDSTFTIAASGDKNKTFTGFIDDVILFNEALDITSAELIAADDFVLSKNVALKSKAAHWWRMGDDNNDKVSKENSISSQSNRIYDQIGVSHLTPQRFRSASSGIHDVKKYPDGFIDDLVEMIDSIPGFSLEKFCQLLLLMTMNMMGVQMPKLEPFALPRAKTINMYGNFWEQLGQVIERIAVEVTLELILYLLGSISTSCDDISKMIDGDWQGTKLGRTFNGVGEVVSSLRNGDMTALMNSSLTQSTAKELLENTDKMLNAVSDSIENFVKVNVPAQMTDPVTGEVIDNTAFLESFSLRNENESTSDDAGFEYNWLTSGNMKDDEEPKKSDDKENVRTEPEDAEYSNKFGAEDIITAAGSAAAEIGPSELFNLFKGQASLETLLVIAEFLELNGSPLYNIVKNNPTIINEAFGIIGISTGLNTLSDKIMSEADEVEEELPTAFLDKCFMSSDVVVQRRAQALAGVMGGEEEDYYDLVSKQLEDQKSDFRETLDKLFQGQSGQDPDGNFEVEEENCSSTPYDSVPEPEILNEIYQNAINVAIGGIKMAYDADCVLYKPAIAEEQQTYKKVPKIIWANEKISFTSVESGQVVQKSGRLKETIMNPEFKGMVSNGFIPMKKDGTTDGSEFGAVLRIKWSPPFSEGWLQKTERISLGFESDGETSRANAKVDDLPGALGPYTDYDEDNGGSPYAFKPVGYIELASNVKRHLRRSEVDKNYFSGRRTYNNRFKDFGTEQSKLLNEYNKKRAKRRKLQNSLKLTTKQIEKIEQSDFSGFLSFFTGELRGLKDRRDDEKERLKKAEKAEQKAKKKYEDATVRDVEVVGGYRDKSFYALEGRANETVLTRAAKQAGYYDPVPAMPTFEVINGNTFGSLINNTSSFQIKRYGKDEVDIFITRENAMDQDLRSSPQMSNYVEENCSIFDEEGGLAIDPYTSQENVFSHIVSNKWYSLETSEDFKKAIKSELLDMQVDETPETLSSTYDNIYQEIVKAMAKEVSNSPFLKTVAGTKNPETGKSLIGLHFVNINPTDDPNHILADLDPRIMDFKTFADQFMVNHKFFRDCKVGEENTDGKGRKNTNLVLGLLSIHAAMVARIYSIEFVLQSLFPLFQLDMKITEMLEKVILERIKQDMEKRREYFKDFKEKTIEIQNIMSEYGLVDAEPAETFEDAFLPILRKEFDFVVEKARRVTTRECLEKPPEDIDEEKYERLKNFVIDNTKIIDVKTNRYSSIPVKLNKQKRKKLKSLKTKIEKLKDLASTEQSRTLTNKLDYYSKKLSDTTEELESEEVLRRITEGGVFLERYIKDEEGRVIEKVASSPTDLDNLLHIYSPGAKTFGIRLVYAKLADGTERESNDGATINFQDIDTQNVHFGSRKEKMYVYQDGGFREVSSRTGELRGRIKFVVVHPLAQFEDSIENLTELLGIDLENPEQCEPSGFYDLEGKSSSPVRNDKSIGFEGYINHGDHIHEYKIEPDGTGVTTKTIPITRTKDADKDLKKVADHTHKIVPIKDEEGNTTNFQFKTAWVKKYLVGSNKRVDTRHSHLISIKPEEKSNIPNQLTEHVLEKLRQTTDFRIMFEYCFNLEDIATMVAIYAFMANSTREALRMFDSTKSKIEALFYSSLDSPDYEGNRTGCNEKQMSNYLNNLGNFNPDDLWNPQLLLLLLTTPLYIYKGWAKTADPHVLITQSLVELGQAGFLIPKIKDTKVEIPFTDPVVCETIPLPQFPGVKLDFPGITQVTAAAVTFAPLLVGAPPFVPTPFGLVYYGIVDPLLMLLTSGYLKGITEEYDNGKEIIDSLTKSGLSNILADVPLCADESVVEEEDGTEEKKDIPPEETVPEDSCQPNVQTTVLAAGKSKC